MEINETNSTSAEVNTANTHIKSDNRASLLPQIAIIAFLIFKFDVLWLLSILILSSVYPTLKELLSKGTPRKATSKTTVISYLTTYFLISIASPFIFIFAILMPSLQKGLLSLNGILLVAVLLFTLFIRLKKRGLRSNITYCLYLMAIIISVPLKADSGALTLGVNKWIAISCFVILFAVLDYFEDSKASMVK
jgi:hypothetical protein